MLGQPLQGYFIQPREGHDLRVAKTDNASLSIGSDGKLYKMLDKKDWSKYRTLSNAELQEELNKSREIKENMYTLNGKLKGGKYSSNPKNVIKLIAPQLGTQSHTHKVKKKRWDKDLHTMTLEEHMAQNDLDESDHYETMATLVRNQGSAVDGGWSRTNSTQRAGPTTFKAASGGLDVSQSADDRIHAAIGAMKSKYEQNLHVVEKLFDEKKYMERKIELLERRLQERAGLDGEEDIQRSDTEPIHDHSSAFYVAPCGDRTLKQSKYEPETHVGHRGSGIATHSGYSAGELATMLNSSDAPHASISRPSSAPTRRTSNPSRSGSLRMSAEAEDWDRSDSRSRARQSNTSPALRTSRSSSTGSRPLTTTSLSANLQADADRYVQKRRMWEEQERQKRLDEERYEHQLKERYLRASMNGKEFTEMQKRQEQAEKQAKERLEKYKKKLLEDEQAAQRARREKMEHNKASMANATRNNLSWRELQEIEEAKRKDRIERRKQELAQISALPSSIAENLQKSRRDATPVVRAATTSTGFKAEDPAKVAAKLAKTQKAWELKLEREKERKASRLSVTGEHSSTGTLTKTAMEIRNEQYAAKKEARLREKKEREEAEAQRRKLEEEKKMQRLLNQKVPIGKPTNAAIMKAEKVRNDRIREQEEERRIRAHMRKKELSEKEASAVLQTIISEREHERHGGQGPHYELRGSRGLEAAQKKAADAAAAAREQYRQQLRANKKRIEDSLQNRKSLMERHDSAIAKKTAAQEALVKVAGAVGVDADRRRSGVGAAVADHADLFDPKEQIRLGLKDLY